MRKRGRGCPLAKKNRDILRVLRAVRLRTKSHYEHRHVRGHQVITSRSSFEAALNDYCDEWAKYAIVNYITDKGAKSIGPLPIELQRLPLEPARVILDGVKQTTDIAKGMRKKLGRARAKKFYAKRGIFDSTTFESINFDALELVLNNKPDMYNLWYGKQCSGFCGTGKWLSIWSQGKEDSRCPNCNRLNEDAAHLMVCPSVHRTTLFQRQVEDIDTWMKTHHTEPHLRKGIRLYLASRGKRKFSAIWGMPIGMKQLAWEQDCIGWRHFTEGKICKGIRARQEMYLCTGGGLISRRTRGRRVSWRDS